MKFGPRVEVEEIDPRSLIAQPTGYSSGLDWQTQHSKESQRCKLNTPLTTWRHELRTELILA